ncbi:uncharacterized protein A4U43_C02F19090 [Asparagus officinalis]|uniref:Exonuclease domain-containing protein n=1 Tax=Asparagus officinalis TaxID=4686 RepID=A0A5P1FJK4_ASPOF|nr:small RNA degrading nuclease 1-like [Asparagus officinalis]ONK78468.1 uncharacterized protein A4U43_C02F19090 [Asparagus officinalis]
MEEAIAKADKEVLAEIVKFSQKNSLKGSKGGWKEFLDSHDQKFGSGLSDPSKRSADVLIAFLLTFTKKDCKFLSKMIKRRSDRAEMERFVKEFPDQETPEQRLVQLTVEHPQYTQHYSFPSHDEDWMIVPLGKIFKVMSSQTLLSVDCEMVLCRDGTDAVVRVCAVGRNLEVKLDKLVKPSKDVVDYRTYITGISAKDLEGVTCSLDEIQKSLKKLLSHGTILVGHALHNDLKALKIDYPRVIDTASIFKLKNLPTTYSPSLNNLCKSVLGYEVRKEGEPHNCLTDAQAAMKLVLAKLENGFDDPIAIDGKNVPESDLMKLFLHKVPVEVPCQELRGVFSVKYDIDIQDDLRVRGQHYSTFAIFKDAGDAYSAFRGIEGQETMDTSGRLQKNVTLTQSTGRTFTFYVRRMTADGLLNNIKFPKKRNALEDDTQDQKRQRTSLLQCYHIEEIEKLKQELRDRDDLVKEIEKLKQELRDREDRVEEIEKLKQDLHDREDEIFKLQEIIASREET